MKDYCESTYQHSELRYWLIRFQAVRRYTMFFCQTTAQRKLCLTPFIVIYLEDNSVSGSEPSHVQYFHADKYL
jgi:hypothetical protein